MAVTLIYPDGLIGFKRSYISGFVGSSNVTNLTYSGVDVEFDYLAPQYHVQLRVFPYFRSFSSNFYTLDYVFDAASSQVYLNGSPIAAGVGVRFRAMLTEPTWRIQVLATLGVDESQKANLPSNGSYWRQLW